MSDTEDVTQAEEAGCRTCSISCLGSWVATLFLFKLQDYLQGNFVFVQLALSMTLGLILGHLTIKAWHAESRPTLGCFGLGLSLLVLCGALLNGYLTYQTVLERNMPGWGKADIASYQYPSLSDFMPTLCLGTLGIGSLLAMAKGFRRTTKTVERESF